MASREEEVLPSDENTLTEAPVEGTSAEPEHSVDTDSSTQPADSDGQTAGDSREETRVAESVTEAGDSVRLTAKTEHHCYSPSSKQECWAITSLKAPRYEPTSRASVDIVAVIDKSGSMRGEKIALVRKTLEFVIDQLKDTDRISLVVYDTNVELVFGLMKMTEENRKKARAFVSSIKDGSSTNLCGGLLAGMEQVAVTNGLEKSQVQSVLLLTDGLANHGITHKAGILSRMEKMQNEGLSAVDMFEPGQQQFQARQQAAPRPAAPSNRGGILSYLFNWGRSPEPQQTPAQQSASSSTATADSKAKKSSSSDKFEGTVYTFGFGSDHDADMLEAISTQGGGVYYYIDSNDKIPESFADCLGGLLSVMGQNVSVKLEALGDTTFKKVHTSKAVNWTTPNKICEVSMGDIQSEESRDLVLELELAPVRSGGATEDVALAKTELSYFNVITSQFDTMECLVTANRTDGVQGPGDITVDIQRNRVQAAAALKEAESLATQGDLKGAQQLLQTTSDRLQGSVSKDEDLVKLLVADLKKCMESMKNRDTYDNFGKNYVRSKQQSHSVQRTNYVEDFDEEVVSQGYMNMSRMRYREEASAKKSSWF